MARSSTIWVVLDHADALLAAFTVKREMVMWCKRQPPALVRFATVWRLGDGVVQGPPKYIGGAEGLLEVNQ
jgi:hypothetical protein